MRFLNARRVTNDANPKRIDECIYSTYSPPISIFEFPPPAVARPPMSRAASPYSTTPPRIPVKMERSRTPSGFQTPPTLADSPVAHESPAKSSLDNDDTAGIADEDDDDDDRGTYT